MDVRNPLYFLSTNSTPFGDDAVNQTYSEAQHYSSSQMFQTNLCVSACACLCVSKCLYT